MEQLEINSAVTSDKLVVISGLNVYRDELVLLHTYLGILSERTNDLSVESTLIGLISHTCIPLSMTSLG